MSIKFFDSYSLKDSKRQYSKPLPKKLNFKAGSAFENLTLNLDSVRKDTCGKSTLILSITLSSVNEAEKRNFIRKSWGSSDLYLYTKLRPIFLLGTTNNNSLQEGIEKEAKIFKDILQINYMDTYRNLTFKSMAGLSWISENCRITPWILKIDHDVMLNPFNLRKFLEKQLQSNPSQNVIIGRYRDVSKPFRSGRWGVSKKEYPDPFFPPFTLGPAYIISRNAVDKLLNVSNETPFLSLEDVFITGILARRAKVKLKDIEWEHYTNDEILYFLWNEIFLLDVDRNKEKLYWELILEQKPVL
ncbi:UNVERIFIED_CONTAM: hypothetical protein RMT77_005523 [Armadillidium vulgare]